MQIFDGNKIEVPFEEGRGKVEPDVRGKTCFVYRGSLLHEVAKYYGREPSNLCLKIFFAPLTGELDSYYWGSAWRIYSKDRTEEIGRISRLTESVTVQNWLWMEGKAPRVYSLFAIDKGGKLYPAMLTEYLKGTVNLTNTEWRQNMLEEIDNILSPFNVLSAHKMLPNNGDFIDGKIIDLQGYRFSEHTQRYVREYVCKLGKYGKTHYQDIEEIGLTGKPRNTGKRIKAMKLDEIDFEDKDVLDVGCNSGAFSMYASSRGSRRVIGLDLPDQVKAAQVLAFYLGYHNIDYVAFDLVDLKDCREYNPDITFFLSMNIHVGFPTWVHEHTKELMIFEENAKKSEFKPDYWKEELSKYFDSVDLIGTTNDQNPKHHKPIFWCRKVLK